MSSAKANYWSSERLTVLHPSRKCKALLRRVTAQPGVAAERLDRADFAIQKQQKRCLDPSA